MRCFCGITFKSTTEDKKLRTKINYFDFYNKYLLSYDKNKIVLMFEIIDINYL